jgi:hypothetical protein
MSTSSYIGKPQPVKERPNKITIKIIYQHIKSLEKRKIKVGDNIETHRKKLNFYL